MSDDNTRTPDGPSWAKSYDAVYAAHDPDDIDELLCDAGLIAHRAILDGIGGVGDAVSGYNEMIADHLYRRMLIETTVAEFSSDTLVDAVNKELAARGAAYRLVKVPAT